MKRLGERRLWLSILKASSVLLTLACLAAAAHFFDLDAVTDPDWVAAHLQRGPLGMLLFMGLTAVFSAAGVPRQVPAALGGYAFGFFLGTLLVSIALPLGCALGFFYARLLGRSSLQRRFGPRIAKLNAFLTHRPFAMTVAVRFFPLGHNGLINLLAGITGIPFVPFLLGSAVGYLPQSVIFCLLGSGFRVDPLWRGAIACLLFLVSTCIGVWLYRKHCRAFAESVEDQPA